MDVYAQSDEALIRLLGARLKTLRVQQNLSQQQVADLSGLSRSAVSQAELGRAITLGTLLQILRVLQQLELLMPFFEELPPSPMLLLKQAKRHRQRAYKIDDPIPATLREPDTEW